MKPTIAIALSGGIDSLTAAALLRQKGHRLIGLHFVTGYEQFSDHVDADRLLAPGENMPVRIDAAQAALDPLAAQLDIPIKVVDLSIPFQQQVVDYFTRAYARGLTPNPCLVCNPQIKFGVLFETARRMGVRYLATGHYARTRTANGKRVQLLKGVDEHKDQSYFLSRLTAKQLRHASFPLGDWTKQAVQRHAREIGLKPVAASESQDICFVGTQHYGDFIVNQPGFSPRPGPIEDINGNRLGQHSGLHRFTIGQRRGINCPSDAPWYVTDLDPDRNRLVVGRRSDLVQTTCRVAEINWICEPPTASIEVDVRIRYRHAAVAAVLEPLGADAARLHFTRPESAVTPGQGAVFYRGESVLGGGWIARHGAPGPRNG